MLYEASTSGMTTTSPGGSSEDFGVRHDTLGPKTNPSFEAFARPVRQIRFLICSGQAKNEPAPKPERSRGPRDTSTEGAQNSRALNLRQTQQTACRHWRWACSLPDFRKSLMAAARLARLLALRE